MLDQLADTLIHANGASRATDAVIKQVFNDPMVVFEFREGHSIESAPAYTNSIDESVRIAQSYGGYGEVVYETAEFAPALARARTSDAPAIIELITDSAALSPRQNLA